MSIKLYPEGPEAEDDDYEVDSVSEEHKNVNISDSTVLWLDKGSEKLKDWTVERPTPNTVRVKKRGGGVMVSLKLNTKVISTMMKRRRASLDIC